jgi:hypothetical protein
MIDVATVAALREMLSGGLFEKTTYDTAPGILSVLKQNQVTGLEFGDSKPAVVSRYFERIAPGCDFCHEFCFMRKMSGYNSLPASDF